MGYKSSSGTRRLVTPTVNKEKVKRLLMRTLREFVNSERILLKQDPREESISTSLLPYLKKYFDFWRFDIDHQYDKRILEGGLAKKTIKFLKMS